MKALTIRQPWASLIALGVKTIETRSWPTRYRGPIAIHAGLRHPYKDLDHLPGDVEDGFEVRWLGGWRVAWDLTTPTMGLDLWHEESDTEADLPLGAIVATATLVDVLTMIPAGTSERNGEHRIFIGDGAIWRTNPSGSGPAVDLTDQRPYGDFEPGRYAWLLDDIKSTTERCPACWGLDGVVCFRCMGYRGCDPIPAKGKQGLWTWGPAA